MRFRYGPEHEQLRDGLRRLLADVEPGASPGRLASEFGVFGLAVPDEFGGSGAGLVELGLVFHEAGRALLGAPLLSSALAASVLVDTGATDLLPAVADGSRRYAVVLDGGVDWIFDGVGADGYLLVDGEQVSLVDDADAEPMDIADLTRAVARVQFDRSSGRSLGTVDRAHLDGVGRVLIAAEQTGVAARCLESAVAWAKEREQFGRPIGSFQAIKHKLADVALEVEAATSASMFALWTADHDRPSLRTVARIAAVTCSSAAMLAAEENIQVHGGIGATWEHDAHRYLRRATTNRMLFGDEQEHLEVLAAYVAG